MTANEINDRRRDLSNKVVELTVRIFELRGKFYPGYGTNWDWTRSAGRLLGLLNDYHTRFDGSTLPALEVVYETLLENVVSAEAQATPMESSTLPNGKDERDVIAAKLPKLALRVFALKSKSYPGCGYHWAMVKAVGYLLEMANDREAEFTVVESITLEGGYESLVESITKAERGV